MNSTYATVFVPASEVFASGTASVVATNPGATASNALQITNNWAVSTCGLRVKSRRREVGQCALAESRAATASSAPLTNRFWEVSGPFSMLIRPRSWHRSSALSRGDPPMLHQRYRSMDRLGRRHHSSNAEDGSTVFRRSKTCCQTSIQFAFSPCIRDASATLITARVPLMNRSFAYRFACRRTDATRAYGSINDASKMAKLP